MPGASGAHAAPAGMLPAWRGAGRRGRWLRVPVCVVKMAQADRPIEEGKIMRRMGAVVWVGAMVVMVVMAVASPVRAQQANASGMAADAAPAATLAQALVVTGPVPAAAS